jgi:hypothetical protein
VLRYATNNSAAKGSRATRRVVLADHGGFILNAKSPSGQFEWYLLIKMKAFNE